MRKHTGKEHFQTVQRVSYTGDVICDTCGKLVEQGQTLESGEHTVEVVDAREANCYIEGKQVKKNVQYVIKY